jgi:hypothetical protein
MLAVFFRQAKTTLVANLAKSGYTGGAAQRIKD